MPRGSVPAPTGTDRRSPGCTRGRALARLGFPNWCCGRLRLVRDDEQAQTGRALVAGAERCASGPGVLVDDDAVPAFAQPVPHPALGVTLQGDGLFHDVEGRVEMGAGVVRGGKLRAVALSLIHISEPT